MLYNIIIIFISEYVFAQDIADTDFLASSFLLDEPEVPSEEKLDYACP